MKCNNVILKMILVSVFVLYSGHGSTAAKKGDG